MRSPEKFEPRYEPEVKPETEEVKEKERKELELIENSSLDLQDKVDLLLVYLKEKPAGWLGEGTRFYKTDPEKEKMEKSGRLAQRREETKKILESLNLPNYTFKQETEEEKNIVVSWDSLIGQDIEKLNQLKEAWQSGEKKEIGLALGYPESAVDGFIKGEIFDIREDLKNLPKEEKDALKKEQVLKFLNFGLSKNNWREELELVRKYQKTIKEKSSKIYDEIIKTRRDPFTFRGRLETKLERILNKIEYLKRNLTK